MPPPVKKIKTGSDCFERAGPEVERKSERDGQMGTSPDLSCVSYWFAERRTILAECYRAAKSL